MKKVLALVLAVAMMATVAFAAEKYVAETNYEPDTEIGLSSAIFKSTGDVKDLNTKNYTIKKVSYETGKAYVASIVLTDDDEEDELTVTLKQDYTLEGPKTVEATITLNGKGTIKDATADVKFTVGYGKAQNLNIIDKDETDEPDDGIYKVKGTDDAPYGTMVVENIQGIADLEVRVYDGDKFFWRHNVDADKKVLIANADADATISFLNFEGKPSFNSTATLYFYDMEEDGFVYELTAAGQIKKSAAKWSEDDGAWVLKTRTLGSYVFSDKALASAAAADDTTTTNPDTGANDVVGIATALAVVSLVAAGAVSLKK